MADNIRVVARFRPINKREKEEGDGLGSSRLIVDFTGANTLDLENHLNREAKKHTFNFDHVIPTDWSQQQVYETTAKPLLDDLFNGISVCQLYYGQTGAGKTFSSFGIKTPEGRGVVPRFAEDIFSRIGETPDVEFTVKVSYVEIYNEAIRDLLDTSKVNLKVRSSNNTVWIEDVTQEYVTSAAGIQEVINRGASSRAVASTLMNAESSRSHSVVLITLGQKSARGVVGAKLTIVDLAGSERVSKTSASGDTLKEAQNINRSLSALGNVINALSTPAKKGEKNFVPYRDSKLTWLLSDCLGGTSKTVMFIAASPCFFNLGETYSTCLFGQRCKMIKNKVVVNHHLSEAEYQRLLALKDEHILILANILGDVYQKLNNMYTNVSQVGLDVNKDVPTELTPYQRGQIAYTPNPTKHETWNQYKGEYEPSLVDVPRVVGAVQEKQDLEKVFNQLTSVAFTALTPSSATSSPEPALLSPPPQSYLSIDPTIDLPPESDTTQIENYDSMLSPSDMPELMSPVPKNGDDGEAGEAGGEDVINLDNFDDQTLLAIESLPKSASSSALTLDPQPTQQQQSQQPSSPELITTRGRTNSFELPTGQLKLFTTGTSDQSTSSTSTPTDQVLSLLRSHFNKDVCKTQEILDSLLTTGNKEDLTAKLLSTLSGHAAVAAPAKKKVVKKKVVAKETTDIADSTPAAALEAGDDEKELDVTPVDKDDDNKDADDLTTSSKTPKKIVKKVVKKVVKKSSTPAALPTTTNKTEDDSAQIDAVTIDTAAAVAEQESKVDSKPEQVVEPDSTPVEVKEEPKPLIESVISDDIFANTATANFATYSPHTSDNEGDDETNTPQDQSDYSTKIVFDDDGDDFKPTIISDDFNHDQQQQQQQQENTTPIDISRTDSDSDTEHQSEREAEAELQVLTLKHNLEELQRQFAETQLHIKSLKLQNDLLKEQQEDLQNQATSAQQKQQLSPQQQQHVQDLKEKQLVVQNDALSIALERKCRDLIKSEVRLSSCVYHIERLEDSYQTIANEKAELSDKLGQSQQQVASIHSLSRQLLKTAKYWQDKAEKAEELYKQQQTVTGGTALLPKGSVGATIVATPSKSTAPTTTQTKYPPTRPNYLPPPTKGTMSQLTKSGDMKNFF